MSRIRAESAGTTISSALIKLIQTRWTAPGCQVQSLHRSIALPFPERAPPCFVASVTAMCKAGAITLTGLWQGHVLRHCQRRYCSLVPKLLNVKSSLTSVIEDVLGCHGVEVSECQRLLCESCGEAPVVPSAKKDTVCRSFLDL